MLMGEAVDEAMAQRLGRLADACRREDGSDIPLGEQLREAAALIRAQAVENERLREALWDAEKAMDDSPEMRGTPAHDDIRTALGGNNDR
jgi:hypothetical protein